MIQARKSALQKRANCSTKGSRDICLEPFTPGRQRLRQGQQATTGGAAQERMGGGEQAAAALRTKLQRFREKGEVPAAVGYGLPTALIVLALLWPFLYGVVPSRDNLCGNQPV